MLRDKGSSLRGSQLFQVGAIVGDDKLDEEKKGLGLFVVLILEDACCILHIALLGVEDNLELLEESLLVHVEVDVACAGSAF